MSWHDSKPNTTVDRIYKLQQEIDELRENAYQTSHADLTPTQTDFSDADDSTASTTPNILRGAVTLDPVVTRRFDGEIIEQDGSNVSDTILVVSPYHIVKPKSSENPIPIKWLSGALHDGQIVVLEPLWKKDNSTNIISYSLLLKKDGNINIEQDVVVDQNQKILLQWSDNFPITNSSSGSWTILSQTGGVSSGINVIKTPCRVAGTGNNALHPVYNVTIDGITLVQDDRVLIKDQTTSRDNGIYTVGVVVAGGATFTRAKDFDSDVDVKSGVIIPIEEGTLNGDLTFQLTTNNPIEVGVTSLTFEQFNLATPMSSDLDMSTFDITNVDGLKFGIGTSSNDTVGASEYGMEVYGGTSPFGILFNVPTGKNYYWNVNGSQIMNLSSSQLNITNKSLYMTGISSPSDPSSGSIKLFADTDNSNKLTVRKSDGSEVNLENVGVADDDDVTWSGKHVWDNDETWLHTYTTDSLKDTHCHVKFQGDGLEHPQDSNYDYTDYDNNPSQRVATFGKYGTHQVKFIAEIIGHGDAEITDPDGSGTYTIPNSDPAISLKTSLVMNTFSIYDLDQVVFGQQASTVTPPMLNNWVGIQANTGEDTTDNNNPPTPVLNGMSLHTPASKKFFFKVGKGSAGEEAEGSNVHEAFTVGGEGIRIGSKLSTPSSSQEGWLYLDGNDIKAVSGGSNNIVNLSDIGSGSGGFPNPADADLDMNGKHIMKCNLLGISNSSGTNIGSYTGEIDGSVNVGVIAFQKIEMVDVTDTIATFTDKDRDGINFHADLHMNTYNIDGIDAVKFSNATNSNDTVANTEYGIEIDGGTNNYGMRYNVPDNKYHNFYVNGTKIVDIGENEMCLNDRNLDVGNAYIELQDMDEDDIGDPSTNRVRMFVDKDNGDHMSIRRGSTTVDLEGIPFSTLSAFTTDLLPNSTGDYDLGSASKKWDMIWVNKINFGSYTIAMPTTAGTTGQALFLQSSGNLGWSSIVNNPMTESLRFDSGYGVKSFDSTEIAIQVTDDGITVGSRGTMQIPYLLNNTKRSGGTTYYDSAFGNKDGCIGIQYDSTENAGSGRYRLWLRANGAWYSAEHY